MPVLKSVRAILLNRSHPLARGLVGCWLFNEATGRVAFDLTGNGNIGSLQANTSWTAGKYGSCLTFDGIDDYVDCGNNSSLQVDTAFSISAWFKSSDLTTYRPIVSKVPDFVIYWVLRLDNDGKVTFRVDDNVVARWLTSPNAYDDNKWHHAVAIRNSSGEFLYVDGSYIGSAVAVGSLDNSANVKIGNYLTYYFNGSIDHVMIYHRDLSATEVAWLYCEPFCMFEPVIKPGLLVAPTGQFVNLAGTSTAQSSTTATAKLIKSISGSSTAVSEESAALKIVDEVLFAGLIDVAAVFSGKLTLSYRGPWLKSLPKMERYWLTDVLFNGLTANAFKLGTVLTSGWFWMRPSGCIALYCGPSMEQIDFTNILEVVEQNADSVSLPNYIPHKIDSTYFYVVRKFNICGYQEHTSQAAVKLAIDAEGNLTEPKPNHIFAWRVSQIDGNKVQLVWFYCPLEQKSQPMRFKVYNDGGTGQINYENPIAEIVYRDPKFYSCRSDTLAAGRYLFAIRSEDTSGVQDNSLAQMAIEIVGDEPNAVEILKVETI